MDVTMPFSTSLLLIHCWPFWWFFSSLVLRNYYLCALMGMCMCVHVMSLCMWVHTQSCMYMYLSCFLSLLNVLCLLVLIFIHFGLLLAISSNIFGHYFFQIIFCLYPLWVCTYTYIKHANIISQVIEAQFIIFSPFFSLSASFSLVYTFLYLFSLVCLTCS